MASPAFVGVVSTLKVLPQWIMSLTVAGIPGGRPAVAWTKFHVAGLFLVFTGSGVWALGEISGAKEAEEESASNPAAACAPSCAASWAAGCLDVPLLHGSESASDLADSSHDALDARLRTETPALPVLRTLYAPEFPTAEQRLK